MTYENILNLILPFWAYNYYNKSSINLKNRISSNDPPQHVYSFGGLGAVLIRGQRLKEGDVHLKTKVIIHD